MQVNFNEWEVDPMLDLEAKEGEWEVARDYSYLCSVDTTEG